MLGGIDISGWQKDLDLDDIKVDFCVVKATEGLNYVNPHCDKHIQQAIAKKILWGFYHFAKSNDAKKEANYFFESCRGYIGQGIPVLDWEESQSVSWVNEFVREFKRLSGIWPIIYGNPWRFNQGGVEQNCGRWIASYPSNLLNPNLGAIQNLGDCPETDGLVCMWQFASDGRIPGYGADLDLNVFYGDAKAWKAYAGISTNSENIVEKSSEKSNIIVENSNYKVTIEEK